MHTHNEVLKKKNRTALSGSHTFKKALSEWVILSKCISAGDQNSLLQYSKVPVYTSMLQWNIGIVQMNRCKYLPNDPYIHYAVIYLRSNKSVVRFFTIAETLNSVYGQHIVCMRRYMYDFCSKEWDPGPRPHTNVYNHQHF